MDSRTETVLTATLLTVLISFPTVSQGIDYSQNSDTSPIVSSSTDIDTDLDISQENPSTVTVEKHNAVYELVETPVKRIEKLETPEATLKIEKINRSSVSIVSSPYGTFRKGMVDGRKVSSFKGANRSKLRSQMSELRDQVSTYRSMARKKMLPDVEVRITRSKASDTDERVEIDNDETESVNLAGWTLKNSDGDEYSFEEVEIPARASAMVYTAEKSSLNITEDNKTVYVYGTGTDWDSDSETALIFNVDGTRVDTDSY